MAKTWANEQDSSPMRYASCRNLVKFVAEFTIGASGVVATTDTDAPCFTCARNAMGIYDLVIPKGAKAYVTTSIRTNAATIVNDVITLVVNANAGTAQIKCRNASLATITSEAESGLVLVVTCEVVR